ncbi:hypothetical protein [Salinithrix halophila]|uniref:Lipoprotein n=1 Tax=Salinithrix halophila TaxID=1485204 RepID=A0ABV8JBW7_9BACL
MTKKWFLFVFIALMMMILAGCSLLLSQADKKSGNQEVQSEEKKDTGKSKEDDGVEGAQSVNESYEEIPFQAVNWIGGSPDRQARGGIWVYTKEKHPGNIDDSFDWDNEDVLLVQVSDKEYEGYEMNPKGLQFLDNDVIRVVVQLKKDDLSSKDEAPRRYIKVEKGSLDGKKFIVETEEGDRLKTN